MAGSIDMKSLQIAIGALGGAAALDQKDDMYGAPLGAAIGGFAGHMFNFVPPRTTQLFGGQLTPKVTMSPRESKTDELVNKLKTYDMSKSSLSSLPTGAVAGDKLSETYLQTLSEVDLAKLHTSLKFNQEFPTVGSVAGKAERTIKATNIRAGAPKHEVKMELTNYFQKLGYTGNKLDEKTKLFTDMILKTGDPVSVKDGKMTIGHTAIKLTDAHGGHIANDTYYTTRKVDPFARLKVAGMGSEAVAEALGIQLSNAAAYDSNVKKIIEEGMERGLRPDDMQALMHLGAAGEDPKVARATEDMVNGAFRQTPVQSGMISANYSNNSLYTTDSGAERSRLANAQTHTQRSLNQTTYEQMFNLDKETGALNREEPFRRLSSAPGRGGALSEQKQIQAMKNKDMGKFQYRGVKADHYHVYNTDMSAKHFIGGDMAERNPYSGIDRDYGAVRATAKAEAEMGAGNMSAVFQHMLDLQGGQSVITPAFSGATPKFTVTADLDSFNKTVTSPLHALGDGAGLVNRGVTQNLERKGFVAVDIPLNTEGGFSLSANIAKLIDNPIQTNIEGPRYTGKDLGLGAVERTQTRLKTAQDAVLALPDQAKVAQTRTDFNNIEANIIKANEAYYGTVKIDPVTNQPMTTTVTKGKKTFERPVTEGGAFREDREVTNFIKDLKTGKAKPIHSGAMSDTGKLGELYRTAVSNAIVDHPKVLNVAAKIEYDNMLGMIEKAIGVSNPASMAPAQIEQRDGIAKQIFTKTLERSSDTTNANLIADIKNIMPGKKKGHNGGFSNKTIDELAGYAQGTYSAVGAMAPAANKGLRGAIVDNMLAAHIPAIKPPVDPVYLAVKKERKAVKDFQVAVDEANAKIATMGDKLATLPILPSNAQAAYTAKVQQVQNGLAVGMKTAHIDATAMTVSGSIDVPDLRNMLANYNKSVRTNIQDGDVLGMARNGRPILAPKTFSEYYIHGAEVVPQGNSKVLRITLAGDHNLSRDSNFKTFGSGAKMAEQNIPSSDFTGYFSQILHDNHSTSMTPHALGNMGNIADVSDAGYKVVNKRAEEYADPVYRAERKAAASIPIPATVEAQYEHKAAQLDSILAERSIQVGGDSSWAMAHLRTSLTNHKTSGQIVQALPFMAAAHATEFGTADGTAKLTKAGINTAGLAAVPFQSTVGLSGIDLEQAVTANSAHLKKVNELVADHFNTHIKPHYEFDQAANIDVSKVASNSKVQDMFELAYETKGVHLRFGATDKRASATYNPSSGGKGMSWMLQQQLQQDGYTHEALELFGHQREAALYDLKAVQKMGMHHDVAAHDIMPQIAQMPTGKASLMFSEMTKADPESFAGIMERHGVDVPKGGEFHHFNLQNAPAEKIQSIPLHMTGTSRTLAYENDAGMMVQPKYKGLAIKAIELDAMVSRATVGSPEYNTALSNLSDHLDNFHTYNTQVAVPKGSDNIFKKTAMREVENSSYSLVKPYPSTMPMPRNDDFGTAGVTLEGAVERLKLAGHDTSKAGMSSALELATPGITPTSHHDMLSKFVDLHTDKAGGDVLMDPQGRHIMGLAVREPSASGYAAYPVKYANMRGADKGVHISDHGSANVIHMDPQDQLYSKLMYGDFDYDHITEFLPKHNLSNAEYSQLENLGKSKVQAANGAKDFITSLSGLKSAKKEKELSDFMIDAMKEHGQSGLTRGEIENHAMQAYLDHVNASHEKQGVRQTLSPTTSNLNTGLGSSLFEARGAGQLGNETFADARALTHYMLENILKASKQATVAGSSAKPHTVEELSTARDEYMKNRENPQAKRNYQTKLDETLSGLTNAHAHADISQMTPAEQDVHARKRRAIDAVMEADLEHGTAGSHLPVGASGQFYSGPNTAVHLSDVITTQVSGTAHSSLYSTEHDIATPVAKKLELGYDGLVELAEKNIKKNKTVLMGAATALVGGALLTQSAPDFNTGRATATSNLPSSALKGNVISKSDTGPSGRDMSQSSDYITPREFGERAYAVNTQYNKEKQYMASDIKKSVFGSNNISTVRVEHSYE